MVSCNSTPEEEKGQSWEAAKKSFMNSCEDSYVRSFKGALTPEVLDMIDLGELDKLAVQQCGCMFEGIKKRYDSPEDAFANGYDQLMEDVEGCEPAEEELDNLFK